MLPKTSRQRLAQEYAFAARGMREAKDPLRKLYFLSVFHGEAQRVLNWTWDTDLALVYTVLKEAYEEVNNRTNAVITGVDRVVGLPPVMLEALTETATKISEVFQATEVDTAKLYKLLARVAEISYATTGNGHYLWVKGVIKIGDAPTASPPPSEQ